MARFWLECPVGEIPVELGQKLWALVSEDAQGGLAGFSAQKCFTHAVQGREFGVVFSGDTVIDRPHRDSPAMAWAFGRFMRELERQNAGLPLYWMLISHRLRTYRYMPLYFREFFQRFDRPTPPRYAALMERLGKRLFPRAHDPERGIVVAPPGGPYLRSFDAPDRGLLRSHPDCRFFFERNPWHRRGDELQCLARFGEPYARRAAWRVVEKMPSLFQESVLLAPVSRGS